MTKPRKPAVETVRQQIDDLAVNRVCFDGVEMQDLYNDIESLSEIVMALARLIDEREASP